ncbi:MAG: hypothetical protein EA406_10560 [Rhodospirillales bacterium]|nr:MAG: hypothetical protein EA406_10560 [Rhodospirillales bacterium]
MTTMQAWEAAGNSPIDVLEQIVAANDWAFERPSEEEMAVQLPGRWCDFNIYVSWEPAVSTVQFTLNLHMRITNGKRQSVHELLALVNEKVWMGHFAVWNEEGLIVYRHALPLRGSSGPSLAQMEDLVQTALEECERFYPAFQYVIWGGKSATDAMAAAMIETVGEA